MALCIPLTIFSIGCFYVFGSLEHLHGATPSERTFLGVIPMLTSTNLAVRMLKSASLKRRLPRQSPAAHDSRRIAEPTDPPHGG
jgi:Kef-type K+ transport system membrane component KefB